MSSRTSSSTSSESTTTSNPLGRSGGNSNEDTAAAAAAFHFSADEIQHARALLKEQGFDPDDAHKVNEIGVTPMYYFCAQGNVTTVRYLIARGADCRQTDRCGNTLVYRAAFGGHIEILTLLSQLGGAHEDIRKQNIFGRSPLHIALEYGHFGVAKWFIRNDALAPRDDIAHGGGIDDEIMRRDLSPRYSTGLRDWVHDKRLPILAWAQDAVTTHDDFHDQLVLTGTILFPDTVVPEILQIIADFVVGTPQQLRILRQVSRRLAAFREEVPFVH